MKLIQQVEGTLGRKTSEKEIHKEDAEFAKPKKCNAQSPVIPGEVPRVLLSPLLAYHAAMFWQRNTRQQSGLIAEV